MGKGRVDRVLEKEGERSTVRFCHNAVKSSQKAFPECSCLVFTFYFPPFQPSFHRVYIANEGHQSFRLRIDRLLPSSLYRTLNPFCDSSRSGTGGGSPSFRTSCECKRLSWSNSLENAADGPSLLRNIVYRLSPSLSPPPICIQRERVFLSYRGREEAEAENKTFLERGKGTW